MEDKELMMVNEEIEDTEEIEEIPERSGIGTGWAMLIGSGLTLAAIAAGKKAKKAWLNYKAKKERPAEDAIVEVVPEEDEDEEQPDSGEETGKKQK